MRWTKRSARSEGSMLPATQEAMNAVRSVMLDVAIWQDRIAARSGDRLGPIYVPHEGDANGDRGPESGRDRSAGGAD